MDKYTVLYLNWITNKDLLYSTWNSAQCYVATWMGGEFGGEWIHAYVWLSPFAAHLKLHWLCPNTKWKVKKEKIQSRDKTVIKKANNENNICKIFSTSIYLVQLNMKNELEVKEFSMVIVNIFSNLKILWALVLKKFILFNPMLAV